MNWDMQEISKKPEARSNKRDCNITMRSGKGEEDGDAEEEGDGDMLGWVRLSQLFNEACPWGWGCRLELKLARSPIPVAGCDTWQCRVCETQLVAAEDTCRAVAARLAGSHRASHTRLPVAPQGHPETPTFLADSHPYSFGAHHTPTNSNTWGLTLGSQAHFNLQPSGLSFEAARYCLSALCASSTQPSG
ncbi:hypothetical protein PSTT_13323 [Puccinia striiformis]|uniref:Uncharacterized protein n=1 Tax=Puccinia striiformis TaxID=27350 RepID=A0A2S4US79_9BASI|nr:hypothetical protein PSTT_13323 [Puccinia striiformis]